MKSPMILISSGRTLGTLSMQRQQSALYGACLAAAGGCGVLFSGGDAAACAARCDGLLLAGGGDLHPARYGQTVQSEHLSIDPVRDEEEQMLFLAFYDCGKPVLGICRGVQAINVFLGGSLRQHIAGHENCCHRVRCAPTLAACIGARRWSTATTIRQWTRSRPRCTPPPGRRTARSKRCGTKAHRCLACSGTPSVWCRPCATMRRAKTIWRCSAGCASGADSTKPGRKSCPVFSLSCFTG